MILSITVLNLWEHSFNSPPNLLFSLFLLALLDAKNVYLFIFFIESTHYSDFELSEL